MKTDQSKETKRKGPLVGLKDRIARESVKFEEKVLPVKGKSSKTRFHKFNDLRKWDAELERLDREEISIKNSLKEINHRIHEVIHKREVVKSISEVKLQREKDDKKKIDLSLNKINKLVKRNRSENKKKLVLGS